MSELYVPDLRDRLAQAIRGIAPKHGGYMTTKVTPKAAERMADAVLNLMAAELRAAKAEAWDEGWNAYADANRPNLDEYPNPDLHPNPYESEEDRHVDQ